MNKMLLLMEMFFSEELQEKQTLLMSEKKDGKTFSWTETTTPGDDNQGQSTEANQEQRRTAS